MERFWIIHKTKGQNISPLCVQYDRALDLIRYYRSNLALLSYRPSHLPWFAMQEFDNWENIYDVWENILCYLRYKRQVYHELSTEITGWTKFVVLSQFKHEEIILNCFSPWCDQYGTFLDPKWSIARSFQWPIWDLAPRRWFVEPRFCNCIQVTIEFKFFYVRSRSNKIVE